MRILLTLAPLLLGLAFVFLAPAAKADCPHRGNFEHQHCDGVGLEQPLLVDANLEVVGVITDVHPDFVNVLLRLDSGPVTVIATPGFLRGPINPRFESTNCTGDAFAITSSGSDLLGFMPPAAVGPPSVGPPGITIYVQANDVPVEKFIQSVWFEGDCILSASNSPDFRAFVPVEELFSLRPSR